MMMSHLQEGIHLADVPTQVRIIFSSIIYMYVHVWYSHKKVIILR